MDTVVYWIGTVFKLLLFLVVLRLGVWGVFWLLEQLTGVVVTVSGWRLRGFETLIVKSANLEVQLSKLYVSVRWFDSSCRHFFKVNIAGVHVQYYKSDSDNKNKPDGTRKTEVKGGSWKNWWRGRGKKKKSVDTGHSRKTRFLYWCLTRVLKLIELSIHCLEVWLQDSPSPSLSFITAVQVQGQFNAIAKPLPNKQLAVSLEVEKSTTQFLLQTDRPCSTTVDGLYPLAEISLSTKVYLFLKPLERREPLHFVQVNTVPLTISILHEDAVPYGVGYIWSLLSKSTATARRRAEEGSAVEKTRYSPEKTEVVLEDVNLHYHSNVHNRVLSSKLTRISLAASLSRLSDSDLVNNQDSGGLPGFDITVGLQDMSVMDSVGHKSVKLHQMRLISESSSESLSNRLHVDSLHLSLYEGESVFWCSYFQESLTKLRTRLKPLLSSSLQTSSNGRSSMNNFHSLFGLPVSVVTTVEASDWSVQVRMDAASLQSKEPVCRAVMAACAANVQWSPLKDETTTIRMSVRMEDAYLHVPGYHPTVDNPTFYRQRVDNPQVLPSLHKHLWGRIASLGSLTLKAERGVSVVSGNQGNIVKFTNDPLTLSGEGGSLMLEWSQPTVVALARMLQHIQQQYKTETKGGGAGEPSNSKRVDKDSVAAVPSVNLKIQLSDVNAFVYGLTPEAPAAMLRLDAASLSSSSLPSFTLDVHGLLLDDMHLRSFEQAFHCSDIANLPQGVGVATSTMTTMKFDNQVKNLDLNVDKVNLTWNTTAHRCLFHTTSCVLEDIKLLRGVLLLSSSSNNGGTKVSSSTSATKETEIVPLGEIGIDFLKRMPLSFTANVDNIDCVAHVDRRAKVSLYFKTTEFGIHGNMLTGSAQDVGVKFDSHQIFTMEKFIGRFPHESEELTAKREKFEKKLERKTNPVVWLQASRATFVFPYGYNFSLTMDKVMNVKKFLQKLHSRVGGKPVSRLLLAPDVFAECGDIVLQVPDDPLEVKLRTNYELMCDEYEQKTQRLAVLNERLKMIREDQGEIAVSGSRVQSLYESLEEKDSEIYCKRARNLYSSEEPLRTAVFVFSMKNTKLLAMFDPSMLGEEKLVENLKDIDRISPLPDHDQGYKFSTLWGGYVSGTTDRLQMLLRDYPQPLFDITMITIAGRMMFAEQEAQEREQRSAVVEVGHPWSNVTVKRKLPPLKYYYDFEMTSESWNMEYGACIEPGLAQTSIAFGLLTSPTIDPSKPLPYWDKLRLIFHGRIHLVTNEMRLILPSTFNPYNTVEYLEVAMSDLDVQLLTNTQLVLDGAVRMLMHTASKYDSCEFLDLPRAKATLNLNWYCGGKDPNRHHFVVRCAPDKIPIQPDKQEHDSYSTFRSQNLDVDLTLEVKELESSQPSILLYSSTLRCLQQYQNLLKWNVTRPTRRGVYFKNLKPKRPPLLRHCRELKMAVSFPKSVGRYWASKAKQQGVHCCINEASFSIDYRLKLVPIESNLIQRPRANWTICSCNGEVRGITAHVERKVKKYVEDDYVIQDDVQIESLNRLKEVDESTVLLIMDELSYSRQDTGAIETPEEDKFIHCLETRNTRLMWNPSNRNVVLGLYDAYKQAQRLKRDLSTEALKSLLLKFESPATNGEDKEKEDNVENDEEAPSSLGTPLRRRQAGARLRQGSSGSTMLDQLLADINNKFVSYVDERATSDPLLKGVTAGSTNDVTERNWLITLTNTQIALQGVEKNGYLLASSHVAQVFGREHEPKLKEGDLVSKKSWVGKVQELQYFSTVGTLLDLEELTAIPWLPLSVIRNPVLSGGNDSDTDEAPPDEEATLNVLLSALGPDQGKEQGTPALPPGEAVGGLVSCVLNQEESEKDEDVPRKMVQLQRIASRCHCQIFYVTYGEQVEEADVAKSPSSILSPHGSTTELSSSERDIVDTFTFRYPTVDICTTSSQYAMIMDILNNLLLHKEPKKKEALDRNARMRFTLQLSNIQDPRKPIQLHQNRVRKCIRSVRELETELFLKQKSTEQNTLEQTVEIDLNRQLSKAKEELAIASMELRAMIRAFKENQLYMTPPREETETEPPEPTRRIEVWVDDAHWWLTQDDGQLQVADISLTNFSYNRVSFSDDSGEHRLELGTFKVCNLMPNTPTIYQQVLIPYDPQAKHLRVDKNISLRVYCKDKARVAGISVKEHLEVNVVPLAVSLTAKFFQTIQDFFVPKAEESVTQVDTGEPDHSYLFAPTVVQPTPAYGEGTDGNSALLTRGSSSRRSTVSLSSIATTSTATSSLPPMLETKEPTEKGKQPGSTVDDVEKMKERASHVKTFIYVKIPQTTVCITYKSENVSIKDLQNQRVTLPTLEYHNKNWTWTDMLMELKKDYKNAIVHQTLKSAIGMRDSDETAGLSSPILKRHASDLLLGTAQQVQAKAMKGRKLFGKLVSSKEDTHSDEDSSKGESRSGKGSPVASRATYQPPLEPEINLKRTMRKLTKLAQDAQK